LAEKLVSVERTGTVDKGAAAVETFPMDAFEFDPASATITLRAPWKFRGAVGNAGDIRMHGGATAPAGWLLCDGTSYLRADYPDLFAEIDTTFGNVDGTHFNVPNFQGVSPTMPGSQTINARSKTGPSLGEAREDQEQDHGHAGGWASAGGAAVAGGTDRGNAANTEGATVVIGANGTPRVGAYTHGPELGVNFVIKT
jgi:microcystin-dependent protein